MARVKFSALLSEVNGSVGSGCFQNSKGGYVLRNKPIPRNPNSDYQRISRSYVNQVQVAWSGLTAAQQEVWTSFLDFAPSYMKNNSAVKLSGFTLFLKYNLIRLHAGLSILTSFSYVDLAFNDCNHIIEMVFGGANVVFDTGFDSLTDFVLFKITPPFTTAMLSKRRFLKCLPLTAVPGSTVTNFNIQSDYLDLFGHSLADGDQVVTSVLHFSTVAPIIRSDKFFIITVTTS